MNILIKLLLINIMFVAIVFLMGKLLKHKKLQDYEESSPFECGFLPLTLNVKPFSIRFFILGVIFLIFDVELVLLYPLFTTAAWTVSLSFHYVFSLMVIYLSLGFFYEWNNKKMDWLK